MVEKLPNYIYIFHFWTDILHVSHKEIGSDKAKLQRQKNQKIPVIVVG